MNNNSANVKNILFNNNINETNEAKNNLKVIKLNNENSNFNNTQKNISENNNSVLDESESEGEVQSIDQTEENNDESESEDEGQSIDQTEENNDESESEGEVQSIDQTEENNDESESEDEGQSIDQTEENNDESESEGEVQSIDQTEENNDESESEDEIKVINLNNTENKHKNQSENESNIESIIFNNNSNNNSTNLEKFISSNQVVTVEEVIAIDDKNLIYKDDVIHLKELENQLLSEYPVSKQSIKFIQKTVSDEAKKLIFAKNIGVQKNIIMENGIQYEAINDILNNHFKSEYIIPVVLDKHRIYIKLKEDKNNIIHNNENSDNIVNSSNKQVSYYNETLEDPEYIFEDNQLNQLINLKTLFHEKAIDNISYKKYLNQESNMTTPYITDMSSIGIIKKLKNNALVLRYSDIDTIHWSTYNIDDDIFYPVDIFDDATGEIKGISTEVLIKGNDINIIGFMLLNHNDYPTKELNKSYVQVGYIKKIYNSNNNTLIIECENHGLDESDFINIQNSDSIPIIDNVYNKNIKIIDKNNIEINTNIVLTKTGSYGVLYKINKLKYDEYEITKENDILNFNFKKSNYPINISSVSNNIHSRNRLYLFHETTLSNIDYKNVINKIMLTRTDILNLEMENLKNAYTFEDVNNILKKYDIDINNFNYTEISVIKNIFEQNLLKIVNSNNDYKNIVINFNKNKKGKFNDPNFFLSNAFITNPNIEKIYGKYPHIGHSEDNSILRLNWIENKIDNGKIYYLYYLLYTYSQNKSLINTFIKNKLDELQKLYKTIEKNYLKEKSIVNNGKSTHKFYKYQAYIITDDDVKNNFKLVKEIVSKGSVVFYKDNLYLWDGKMVEFKDAPENTLAVVGDKLWVWQKGKWIESMAKPHYENIKYLCEFNNIELENIKLDSLDCIYRKDYGCNSKVFVRLEENYNKIKNDLNNFTKLNSDFNENNTILENIKKNIDESILKYYSGIKDIFINNIESDNKKGNKKSKNKVVKKNNLNSEFELETSANNKLINKKVELDELSVLLNLIFNIKNIDNRLNYIYELIEKDGIIIDNKLFSKKYGKSLNLCGHYYYFKKINDAELIDTKNKLIDNMLNNFSDDGDTEKNIHVCKVCGEYLLNNKYDETEGFSDSGAIKMSRELWVVEKSYAKTSKMDDDSFNLKNYIKNSSSAFNENVLKDILLRYGLSYEDIDLAIFIAVFIIKNLFVKAGVSIENDDMINIIIDSMQKIKTIKPYSIYRGIEIKKLKEKGFSTMDIEKIEQRGTFAEGYKRYSSIRKYSIIIARYLLSIQYSIPELTRSSKTTICAFTSFYEDDGINYMTCIFDEMKIVLLKDKSKSFEILKAGILESYNDLKKLKSIKSNLKKKSVYFAELSKKDKSGSFVFKNSIYDSIHDSIHDSDKLHYTEDGIETDTTIELNTDFLNKIKKSSEESLTKELKNSLYNRIHYLAYKIKNTIKNVIKNSELTDIYTTGVESSCCTEEALLYTDYYYGIELSSNYPVKNDIDESNKIYDYTNYFIDYGSIHKYLLYDPLHSDAIENMAIVDNEENSSESLIKTVFEIYVDRGIYIGTLREYIGTVDNLIDLRTGMTKKEILENNYTIDDYKKLLREIEKRNTKTPVFNNTESYEKSYLNSLKKTSYEKLSTEISKLIKNISIILNKDKIFIDDYTQKLYSFGMFDTIALNSNEYNTVNLSEREIIEYRNSLNRKKADYIKKFYNTKLRKYLSIIKNRLSTNINNNINLKFIDEDEISKDIQTIIIDEQIKLIPFLNEGVRKYFTDLELDYTTEEINKLNAVDNIYDFSFEKVKVFSDFNFNDLSNVLLYILVNQLNSFILCKSDKPANLEITTNINLEKDINLNKDAKCKHICEFILLLFDELEYDTDLFKNCKEGALGIKNSLIYDKIQYKVKLYTKEDTDYISQSMEKKFGKVDSGYESETDSVINDDIEKLDELEDIQEKAKSHYLEKYGSTPTEEQLDKYTSSYLKELQDAKEYDDEVYNLTGQAKGADVLDQGAGYGELNEYDFEDGDGFYYEETE